MTVHFDDLLDLHKQILKDNPPARSDSVLSCNLFRKAVRENGRAWENAAFDLVHASCERRAHTDEANARAAAEAARAAKAEAKLKGGMSKAEAEAVQRANEQAARAAAEAQRAADEARAREIKTAQDRGKSRFEEHKAEIAQMRFANGRGILQQTVSDIQSLGTFAAAILLALPRTASQTDEIGQYLTLDKVTKLRTFNAGRAVA